MNNIVIIFFIFNIFINKLSAQDTTVSKRFIIQNGIGITFSPKYSYPNDNNLSSIEGSYGWGVGISYLSRISKNSDFFIISEIGVMNNGLAIKNIPNTVNLIDAQGNITFEKISNYTLKEKYNYFYISSTISFPLLKISRISYLYSKTGLQLQYLYRATWKSIGFIEDGKTNEFEINFTNHKIDNNYTFSAFGGIGYLYQLNSKFSALFSTDFIYELNTIGLKQPSSIQTRKFINTAITLSFFYNF